MNTMPFVAGLASLFVGVAPVLARADAPITLLPISAVYAQTPAAAPQKPSPAAAAPAGFTEPGWWGLTLSTGYAYGFDDAHSINPLAIAVSTFVAPDLEVRLELGGWVFLQADSDNGGDDTGGASLALTGRWHFWKPCDGWTVYGEAGAGIVVAGSEVPEGGSEFNFNPRAGGGFTVALEEGSRAPRLDVGVRWHHISNARIFGSDRNESRDSAMVYAGITFSL